MLVFSGNTRVFICNTPISMRKSFEGLSATIEEMFPGELLTGSLFVFLNRQRHHMKVMTWDRDGFVIFYKRLEKGTFLYKWGDVKSMDRRAFFMLLEGITPKKIQSRFSCEK